MEKKRKKQVEEEQVVYVALGKERQEEDGLLTLSWVLNHWAGPGPGPSHHPPISIHILFLNSSCSFHFVHTPFGKLPANCLNDNKLKIFRKCEQHKTEHLLSKYLAFCGNIRTEAHNIINKADEPIQKTLVDLIIQRRITKLVIGLSLMTSSPGITKNAVSGLFYVHRAKPEFCELFIICRGKLVMIKEQNDQTSYMEDEEGTVLATVKQKASLKDNSASRVHNNQGELYEQDIEEYFQELESKPRETCIISNLSDQNILSDCVQGPEDRVKELKIKIQAAYTMIESNKNAAKAEIDRQAKASWAICVCNHRAEQIQAHTAEEITTRTGLTKEIDKTKEQIQDILIDVEESKDRLNSLLELQSELSSKLHDSSATKQGVEYELKDAANARTKLVSEIEELRKQREVFQRRIEFCKEKDAISLATRMVSRNFREFSADEIRLATDNFTTYRRQTCGRDLTNVYKGRINRMSVAVKMLDSYVDISQEIFQAKVNLLTNIQHPHITGLIGFCSELKCFVFEYMHNGCLRDIIFSRIKARTLKWHQRIQIAAQISLGLRFLHLAEPRPIVCSELNPSTIFLDRNYVAKLQSFGLKPCCKASDIKADVGAFGDLVLQLLMGRNWAGVDREAMMIDKHDILKALDVNAGDWPSDLVEEVVELAIRCRSINLEPSLGATMSSVTEELNELKKKADKAITMKVDHARREGCIPSGQEWSNAPTNFICPILQVIMENPQIAEDGYSYELDAIEEWLRMGHDTSPVTKQKLKHKHVVPNNNLRFLIQDWRKLNWSISLLEIMDSSSDGDSSHLDKQSLDATNVCLSNKMS